MFYLVLLQGVCYRIQHQFVIANHFVSSAIASVLIRRVAPFWSYAFLVAIGGKTGMEGIFVPYSIEFSS